MSGQRILVKVGGAILDDALTRAQFAESVSLAVAAGDDVVVVHGGGAQVSRLTDALGLIPQRVRGLRVTDDATARAVLQVLGGEVNAMVVAALQRAGVAAIGLTGADGGLFDAEPVDPLLGRVGAVTRVDASVLDRLRYAGFVPVVATVTPAPEENPGSDTGVFLNVNADAAVAPLAAAWSADIVLFLSDVPHVLNGDERIESIDRASCTNLEASGVIAGGMIPKVEAAINAASALPEAVVKIAAASGVDPIAAALQPSHGTIFFDRMQSVSARTQDVSHG